MTGFSCPNASGPGLGRTERHHEQMSIIAKMLNDDDIENVAEWYSSIKITIEMPK